MPIATHQCGKTSAIPKSVGKDEFVTAEFIVNGQIKSARIKAHWTLLQVLRDEFGFTGTKEACGEGACGACTVMVDGVSVLSCMMLALEYAGKSIETIEGLARGEDLHPLQEGWLEEYGAQCGFCSPGMIMSAKGLLTRHPNATTDEIKEGMGGNICICGNYEHILESIQWGQKKMRHTEPKHD